MRNKTSYSKCDACKKNSETKTFFAYLNIYDATDNKVFCKKVKPLFLQKMNT